MAVDEELVCAYKHLIRHGDAVTPSPAGEGSRTRVVVGADPYRVVWVIIMLVGTGLPDSPHLKSSNKRLVLWESCRAHARLRGRNDTS